MIVLQAYADDSGSDAGSEIYALTGYLLPSIMWDTFSDDWLAVCQRPRYRTKGRPRKGIEYYRTNEALGLKEQFAGWTETERNARIVQLASVIADFAPLEVGASVRRSEYEALFSSGFVEHAKKDPYFLLATHVCVRCHVQAERVAIRSGTKVEKVDIFFDKQGAVELLFKPYFDNHLKKFCPFLGECFHVSDNDFLPLQAADMSAARHRRDRSFTALWTSADSILAGIDSAVESLDRAALQRTAENVRTAFRTDRQLSGITPIHDPSC